MYVVDELDCNVFANSSFSILTSDDDRKYEAAFAASSEAASQTTASFLNEQQTTRHGDSATTKQEDAYISSDTDTQIAGFHASERNTSNNLLFYKAICLAPTHSSIDGPQQQPKTISDQESGQMAAGADNGKEVHPSFDQHFPQALLHQEDPSRSNASTVEASSNATEPPTPPARDLERKR